MNDHEIDLFEGMYKVPNGMAYNSYVIVGKYGLWVQKVFKKLENWDIQRICPLHGPILSENIKYYMDLCNTWSCYQPEEDGVCIKDLARCDMTEAVAEAFRYSKLVLATTTYNAELFPAMREFITWLTERNFCNRIVGFIGNGSWGPIAAMLMKEKLEKSKVKFTETDVKIVSALNEESLAQLEMLAEELCSS